MLSPFEAGLWRRVSGKVQRAGGRQGVIRRGRDAKGGRQLPRLQRNPTSFTRGNATQTQRKRTWAAVTHSWAACPASNYHYCGHYVWSCSWTGHWRPPRRASRARAAAARRGCCEPGAAAKLRSRTTRGARSHGRSTAERACRRRWRPF
jgi:hypothetical protein